MRELLRAIDAERLKLRGTLAQRMCAVAPLVVVGLYVMMLLVRKLDGTPPPPPDKAFLGFATECLGLWTFLMLPLFITLQSALLAGLEHGEKQWKHLLALPVPRGVHYVAKFVLLLAMVAAAMLALVALICAGGFALSWLRPAAGIGGPPPLTFLLATCSKIFLAATLMCALHTWIAIRWSSFTVAVATGMSATVVGFLVMQSPEYGRLYPWSMPVQILAGKGANAEFAITAALAGALITFVAGLWDFGRRDLG